MQWDRGVLLPASSESRREARPIASAGQQLHRAETRFDRERPVDGDELVGFGEPLEIAKIGSDVVGRARGGVVQHLIDHGSAWGGQQLIDVVQREPWTAAAENIARPVATHLDIIGLGGVGRSAASTPTAAIT